MNAGSNNTLAFSNPIVGNWAPDFDRIVVNCGVPPPANLRPQDLFSWSSPGVRNLTLNGSRYFSIDSGNTNIVGFNQTPPGDFGDWLSEPCPQPHPRVQNAFGCPDQFSDISATSPEGINLDVIGYNLGNAPTPTPTPPHTPHASRLHLRTRLHLRARLRQRLRLRTRQPLRLHRDPRLHLHRRQRRHLRDAIPTSRQPKAAMRLVLSLPALQIQRSVGMRSLSIRSATSIPVLATGRWS